MGIQTTITSQFTFNNNSIYTYLFSPSPYYNAIFQYH